MNWRTVWALLRTELRQVFRDRLAVFMSIVLPLVVMPIVVFSLGNITARRDRLMRNGEFSYAVQGTVPAAVAPLLDAASTPATQDGARKGPLFRRVEDSDAQASLQAGKLDLVVRLGTTSTAASPARGNGTRPDRALPRSQFRIRPVAGIPEVEVLFYADRERSIMAVGNFVARLERAAETARSEAVLRTAPASATRTRGEPYIFTSEARDVATPGEATGALLGPMAALFLVLFLAAGGSSVALDSLAGEKERGTLETLLTTAAGRNEIIAAKQLSALVFAFTVATVEVLNLAVYLVLRLLPLPERFALQMSAGSLGLFVVLSLALAAFVAAVLLVTSAYARSYREAQMLFFPVFVLLLCLALVPAVPGLPLASAAALMPLSGVGVALRDVVEGHLSLAWGGFALASTIAATCWLLVLSTRMLSSERLMSPTLEDEAEVKGGPALFARRVWLIYALLGAFLLVAAAGLSSPALMRWQVFFNQVVFVLVTTWVIRHYRLPAREALALRPVPWQAWLGVAVLVPAAQVVGTAVSRLTLLAFPIPGFYAQEFSRALDLENTPAWLLYLAVAVIPGICEELAFRGVLLHGLHRKMRPVQLAVTVGLIFGFFHFTLFRIVPTAVLGVLLTSVALLTGSILPCVVAHVGNNALAVFLARHHVDLEALPSTAYVAGLVGLGVAFWILARVRRPYPGLLEAGHRSPAPLQGGN